MTRRIAVVGCGSIGARHLRNLASLGCNDLVAVDPDADRRNAAAAAAGARTAPTLEAALALGASAVFVTAPTHLHAGIARAAAEAGADLFVEKPLAASLDGIDELIDAVDRHDSTALVACNLRFHPGLRRVHELLAAGAIGRVVSAHIEFGSWLPDWRPTQDYRTGYAPRRASGGGVVLDAIHELDYARWLLGEVDDVVCFAGTLSSLELETEDVAAILLHFESGAIGEVHLDYVQREYRRACRVIGELGTLTWDFTTGEARLYTSAARAWTSYPAPAGWKANDMYVAELDHFLACLRGDATPTQTLRDGRRAVEIALAALDSAESRTIVRLAQPPVQLLGLGRAA
jgi:predicted dehydrogenase